MTNTLVRTETATPYGCFWCGTPRRGHDRRWTPMVGMHPWREPDQQQILARMRARRAERVGATPAVYHATTGWAADSTGESAEPYCADCKTDGCQPWMRVQARLDRQRWQLGPSKAGKSGGWGGDEPWPF